MFAENLVTGRARAALAPAAEREIYTVSRLNLEVRSLIEECFPALWVEGEISNLARPRSGHVYFSLKDDGCQVRCAMFRMHNRRLGFRPQDGMQVLVHAQAGLYPERGEFQLVVDHMEEAGEGALRRAYELLKQRLSAEGLFDAEHKRPLPAVPGCIGVITSPTGAAVRDIVSVLGRRFPAARVLIYPTEVQGARAAAEITRVLQLAERRDECDVLILARGGGSLEDLWAFNDEALARAIHACRLPVVTGVGHEIDFTIADFVADERAPTPSAAAELVVPDAAQWRRRLVEWQARAGQCVRARVRTERQALEWLCRRLEHPSRRLFDLSQRVDDLTHRLVRAARTLPLERRARLNELAGRVRRHDPGAVLGNLRLQRAELDRRLRTALRQGLADRRTRVRSLERTLTGLGPAQTLDRGYAILTRSDDASVVRDAASVERGERLHARLAKGRLTLKTED